MVEPFMGSHDWLNLLTKAERVCMEVFRQLPKLEHVEVGICGRVDHPDPTITGTFIKLWGRDVITHENPAYVEDPIMNLAWASSVIIQTVPGKVKSLHLSAANLRELNWFVYGQYSIPSNPAKDMFSVTNLTLDIRGVQGARGRLDWVTTPPHCTSRMVEYWAETINSLPKLVHLQLNGKFGNVIENHKDIID